MVPGESLFSLLPPPALDSFKADISKIIDGIRLTSKIKIIFNGKNSDKSIECYNLPVFDPQDNLVSIKIVGKIQI